MIKCDKGQIAVNGEIGDVIAELTTLMHSLFWRIVDITGEEEDTRELFEDVLQQALLSDEELDERFDKLIWGRMVGEEEW